MVGRGVVEEVLRSMLKDLFEADNRGARRDKLARAHGYTDGYMRALIDLDVMTQKDLLQVVLEERQKIADATSSSRIKNSYQQGVTQPQMNEAVA